MLFEEFKENRLTVLINGEYSFKVATYDESLDIEKSISRIGFQLRLDPKQNFIEDIFNTFNEVDITEIIVCGQDEQVLRQISDKHFKIVTTSIGFFVDETAVERTKGVLALEYSLIDSDNLEV